MRQRFSSENEVLWNGDAQRLCQLEHARGTNTLHTPLCYLPCNTNTQSELTYCCVESELKSQIHQLQWRICCFGPTCTPQTPPLWLWPVHQHCRGQFIADLSIAAVHFTKQNCTNMFDLLNHHFCCCCLLHFQVLVTNS